MKCPQNVSINIEPVDIILGAELTYNELSIDALINVFFLFFSFSFFIILNCSQYHFFFKKKSRL